MVFEALKDYLADDLRRVAARMEAVVAEGWAEEADLLASLASVEGAESLGARKTIRRLAVAGGKRLRDSLALLAARGVDGEGPASEEAVELAAVVELLHLATLIHDDVIDRSDLRRGVPTVHTQVGEHVAVLTGDHLYSHSLWDLVVKLPRLDVVRRLARAVDVLCRGEILQNRLARRGADWRPPTEEQYLSIIRRKTADFFAASGELGALVAGRDELAPVFHRYGNALGLAFQITDDLLDYTGAADSTGKDRGNDWDRGRMTLPLLYALTRCPDGGELRVLLADEDPDAYPRAVELLRACGALDYAARRAAAFIDEALEALTDYPHPVVAELLRETARGVLARRR